MTYNDYLIKITETMKIRSSNYRLSQNDIIYLANNVFTEIGTEVVLEFIPQRVLIDKNVNEYDINALYTQIGNEIPLDVMSIFDYNGDSIEDKFKEIEPNVFRVNTSIYEGTNDLILDWLHGEECVFYRQVIPDIETLSTKLQTLIFNCLIEGMMWYTQDNIPNPISSGNPQSETNLYYQRYYKARENLKNLLPQRM